METKKRIGMLAVVFGLSLLGAGVQRHGVLPQMQAQQADASQAAPPQKVDKKEEQSYKNFYNAAAGPTKLDLGEQFDAKYPSSRYSLSVETALVTLYYQKQDWPKFYAMQEKVLLKNPDEVTVLTLVGWVIPRSYDPNDPNGAAKLNESEKDEKHALEVLETMQKPPQVSDADFAAAKEKDTAQAHSGLGMTYFRRQDFEDSAKELSIAVQAQTPDPTDLYVLGTDLQQLHRNSEAADAFTKCSQLPGALQDRCKQGADAAKKAGPGK